MEKLLENKPRKASRIDQDYSVHFHLLFLAVFQFYFFIFRVRRGRKEQSLSAVHFQRAVKFLWMSSESQLKQTPQPLYNQTFLSWQHMDCHMSINEDRKLKFLLLSARFNRPQTLHIKKIKNISQTPGDTHKDNHSKKISWIAYTISVWSHTKMLSTKVKVPALWDV